MTNTGKTDKERFKEYHKYAVYPKSPIRIMPGWCKDIGKKMHGNILDIGTGDGMKLKQIIRNSDTEKISAVTALDVSPYYCHQAKDNLSEYPFVSVYNLSYDFLLNLKTFDVVLLFDVLEHVDDPDWLLEKITWVMKPDGVLIGSTPNKPLYHLNCLLTGEKRDPTHNKEFTINEFKQFMGKYFKDIKTIGLFPCAWLTRRFKVFDYINKVFPVQFSRSINFFCRGVRVQRRDS